MPLFPVHSCSKYEKWHSFLCSGSNSASPSEASIFVHGCCSLYVLLYQRPMMRLCYQTPLPMPLYFLRYIYPSKSPFCFVISRQDKARPSSIQAVISQIHYHRKVSIPSRSMRVQIRFPARSSMKRYWKGSFRNTVSHLCV